MYVIHIVIQSHMYVYTYAHYQVHTPHTYRCHMYVYKYAQIMYVCMTKIGAGFQVPVTERSCLDKGSASIRFSVFVHAQVLYDPSLLLMRYLTE